MTAATLPARVSVERDGLAATHLLLAVQSVVVILLSINRLSSLTLGYVAPNEFLRWVDLNNMLILPLIAWWPSTWSSGGWNSATRPAGATAVGTWRST